MPIATLKQLFPRAWPAIIPKRARLANIPHKICESALSLQGQGVSRENHETYFGIRFTPVNCSEVRLNWERADLGTSLTQKSSLLVHRS